MGAWGYGIFQSDHDQDIIVELGHEAGLDELEKALERRIKEKKLSAEEHELYVVKKLPPYYTLCGGGGSPKEIREHLDSGVLEKLFEKKEGEMLGTIKKSSGMSGMYADYTFVLLGACAMSLGCRIPQRFKTQIQKHFLHVGMLECPERQMFQALNGPGSYEEGVPYDFKVPEEVTAAHEADMEAQRARGGVVMLNVPAPHGFLTGPPKVKALRTSMDEGQFGGGCGGCGAQKKTDGETLLRCSKCKRRAYCSVECQEEHWKLHKKICKGPKKSLDAAVDAVE